MIKVKAPAKVNLFLEVTGRRPDGYHDLATLFARIGVSDRLSLKRSSAPGIKLSVPGGSAGLPAPADNIVYKAAIKFYEAFAIKPAVEIKLEKSIPIGAGLGGGSSDAAAALLGLARLYKLPRSAGGRLMKIAAAIGSDVPFFMLDAAAAEGYGRGERLKVLKVSGRMPALVLVYPGTPVYTKEVYGRLKAGTKAGISANLRDFRELCRLVRAGGFVAGASGRIFNRLEEPVLPRHKAVRLAKARLLKFGADAALMSGSGASVFGLFNSGAKAARAAAEMGRMRGCKVFLTKFC